MGSLDLLSQIMADTIKWYRATGMHCMIVMQAGAYRDLSEQLEDMARDRQGLGIPPSLELALPTGRCHVVMVPEYGHKWRVIGAL